MDRKTGTLIAFLVILSLGLAYNTVTQSLVRSEKPKPATAASSPVPAAPTAPTAKTYRAGLSGQASSLCPPPVQFETITVAKAAPKAKLVGEWLNASQDRRDLTRVTIAQKPGGLTVAPWALHCTGERPYGEAKRVGATQGNPFELTWEAGYAEHRARFALLDDGRLRVDSATVVFDPDGTQSPIVTDYFTRATPEALKAHQMRQAALARSLTEAEQGSAETKPGGG